MAKLKRALKVSAGLGLAAALVLAAAAIGRCFRPAAPTDNVPVAFIDLPASGSTVGTANVPGKWVYVSGVSWFATSLDVDVCDPVTGATLGSVLDLTPGPSGDWSTLVEITYPYRTTQVLKVWVVPYNGGGAGLQDYHQFFFKP